MFKFLENIDIRLYERYLTVERNIKAASNSFYDAYLDMQEQFVKLVCERIDIDISVHESCGAILKKEIVKDVFTKKLNVDNHTYNKMQDYTLKVNIVILSVHKTFKSANIFGGLILRFCVKTFIHKRIWFYF